MKKIQLLFQSLAIASASVGIAANNYTDSGISYYFSLWPGPNCDIQLNLDVCDEGDRSQCAVFSGLNILYVSKTVDNGPCTSVLKY
jgi:hypothetical protein